MPECVSWGWPPLPCTPPLRPLCSPPAPAPPPFRAEWVGRNYVATQMRLHSVDYFKEHFVEVEGTMTIARTNCQTPQRAPTTATRTLTPLNAALYPNRGRKTMGARWSS